MPNVLFVCTGNMYRSPLAAAFFCKKLQEAGKSSGWFVDSTGTWTVSGQPISPATVLAARKFDINLEGQVAKLIDADQLANADLILVMENGHREALNIEFPFTLGKVYLISEVVDQLTYDIPDPANSGQEIDIVASDLYKLVDRGFPAICRLVEASAFHRS